MTIAAKNDDIKTSLVLDLGQKQSKSILPAIDFVLKQVSLKANELDYTALCEGPGTFTGLRLAFSALKAIQLSCDVPVYGVPTLLTYAYPFKDFEETIIPVIDAKKDQFFAAVYKNSSEIYAAEDTSAQEILKKIDSKEKIIVTGPDNKIFASQLKELNDKLDVKYLHASVSSVDCLFAIAEEMIEQKKEPLKDYSGPVYLRKSEAEIALSKKSD